MYHSPLMTILNGSYKCDQRWRQKEDGGRKIMKITVFNGSPRGRNSNTNVIAEAFLKGAKAAGADTENVFLIDRQIHHCAGCFTCWYKTPGVCVYRDDMDALMERYRESDVVCMATPIYLWQMTACLKNFLDRLIPLKRPNVVEVQGNFDMANSLIKMPETVIISNSGFPGDSNFSTMREVVRRSNPILEIYRNNGMLLRMDRESVKPIVQHYLSFVEQAGFLVASGKAVTEDVMAGLNAEMMSTEDYLAIISGK
jgi:multimeric flavodoxin WrbA